MTRKKCVPCALQIEQFHREVKQTTGIESCQCRKQRIQPQSFGGKLPPKILRCNHIACALLVWTRLKQIAHDTATTVYRLKRSLLSDYLIEQLKSPTLAMKLSSSPHI